METQARLTVWKQARELGSWEESENKNTCQEVELDKNFEPVEEKWTDVNQHQALKQATPLAL